MTPNTTASTMSHHLSRRSAIAAICTAPALATRAFAETRWPRQPVKIVVGLPAGGGTDLLARGLAPHLAAAFGQPFIVENLTGAGGNVAAAAVAHARDGHTLGIVQGGPTTTAKTLNPMISYDPERDFKAVSLLTRVPFVLTVNPVLARRRLRGLARSRPRATGQAELCLDRTWHGHPSRHGGAEGAARD